MPFNRLLTLAAALGALLLMIGAVLSAATAANDLPQTRAGEHNQAISLDDIAPSECDSINLTNRVGGSGAVTGTMSNDWIIGAAGIDVIEGLDGSDCIEGRGGDDVITGGPGTDVCIGGPGTDSFAECETEIQ